MSQRLMPAMPTLHEDSDAVTLRPDAKLTADCADVVDVGADGNAEEVLFLQNQAKIAGKFIQRWSHNI